MKRTILDLHARDHVISLGRVTRIMGIVNCSPDSFSGDGNSSQAACLRNARKLIREGADILDIGGESTRPGAKGISSKEEIKRVIPVIKEIARQFKIPISVDTSKYDVARYALDAGACIINNISLLQASSKFLKMVREYQSGLVIMHMRGNPRNMQKKAVYKDIVKEVIEELQISIEKCLAIGIKKDKIMVDPGIGFAKTVEQNLILINHLDQFKALNFPILLGTSRKSFIGKILNKEIDGRLMGTAATVTAGVLAGAHFVRVHDVKPIKETVRITDAILSAKS